MKRLLLTMVILVAAACGATKEEVAHEELLRMPKEARVAIYDAENDVVIARSRRDEATTHLAALERERKELDAHFKATKERLKKAGQGDRVSLVEKSVDARQEYIAAQMKVTRAAIDTADADIELAQARLEQTMQRQLARTGRVQVNSIEPFDARVAELEKRAREIERRELDLRVEAQKVFETWKQAEDQYVRATSDYNSGVWID